MRGAAHALSLAQTQKVCSPRPHLRPVHGFCRALAGCGLEKGVAPVADHAACLRAECVLGQWRRLAGGRDGGDHPCLSSAPWPHIAQLLVKPQLVEGRVRGVRQPA